MGFFDAGEDAYGIGGDDRDRRQQEFAGLGALEDSGMSAEEWNAAASAAAMRGEVFAPQSVTIPGEAAGWQNLERNQGIADPVGQTRNATEYGRDQYMGGYDVMNKQLSQYDIGAGALQDYQQGVQGWQGMQDYTQSPIYQNLMSSGMQSVNQGAAGSGSLYSGARGEALRDVGQNAMLQANQQNMSAYSNYMQGLGNLVNVGQQTSASIGDVAMQRAGTNADLTMGQADYENQLMFNAMNADRTATAQRDANSTATRGMVVDVIGSAANAAATASDMRLKENIEKVGEYKGHNIYTWDWTAKGKEIAGDAITCGVLAQEVEITRPDLIHDIQGYKAVNYNGL